MKITKRADDIKFTPENKEDKQILSELKGKKLLVTGTYAAIKTW